MSLEIRRDDDAEETTYDIDGRVLVVLDLTFTRQGKLKGMIQALIETYAASGAEYKSWFAMADALLGAFAGEAAEILNWLAKLEDPNTIDAEWIADSFTNKRLVRVLKQIIADNELEPLEKYIRERLFPFFLGVLENRAKMAMLTANLEKEPEESTPAPTSTIT